MAPTSTRNLYFNSPPPTRLRYPLQKALLTLGALQHQDMDALCALWQRDGETALRKLYNGFGLTKMLGWIVAHPDQLLSTGASTSAEQRETLIELLAPLGDSAAADYVNWEGITERGLAYWIRRAAQHVHPTPEITALMDNEGSPTRAARSLGMTLPKFHAALRAQDVRLTRAVVINGDTVLSPKSYRYREQWYDWWLHALPGDAPFSIPNTLLGRARLSNGTPPLLRAGIDPLELLTLLRQNDLDYAVSALVSRAMDNLKRERDRLADASATRARDAKLAIATAARAISPGFLEELLELHADDERVGAFEEFVGTLAANS